MFKSRLNARVQEPSNAVFKSPQRELGAHVDMMWWDNVLGSFLCVGDSHLIVDQLATLLFQAPPTVVFLSPQRELGGAPVARAPPN